MSEKTRIRTTLHEVEEAVAVPAYDGSVVAARARSIRRRRRTAGALAGTAVVAVVAAGVGLLPGAWPGDDPGPVATDGWAAAGPGAGVHGVPVVLDGSVQRVDDDGTLTDTGLRGQVVGVVRDRVVVLDGDRLIGAGGHVEGVVAAYADPTGVTYQRADGAVLREGVGGVDADGVTGRLVGAGAGGFATLEGVVVTLHDADGAHRLDLGSDAATPRPDRVQVGGGTVVVTDSSTVSVLDLAGTRRSGFLGGTTGALSADGATYAYAPTAAEVDRGMRPGLFSYDTGSGQTRRTALPAAALDLTWYDGGLYVLTEDGDTRTLWACDQTCDQLLVDDGGTLGLR